MRPLIAHQDDDSISFFKGYLNPEKKVLFIGTLGFGEDCVYFADQLAALADVDVDLVFFIEVRTTVSTILERMADRNRARLEESAKKNGKDLRFVQVRIVAEDTAVIAGRSAAEVCNTLMTDAYTDVIVDATSMSRGVCFPVVKMAYQRALQRPNWNAHTVVAGRSESRLKITPASSEKPEYMHGFRNDMGVYGADKPIKLWLPQLSEGNAAALGLIFAEVEPEEVGPILPFPSHDPLRGDRLLREYQKSILNEWEVNLVDVIYAHESDPNDVYNTICRIHSSREDAFKAAVKKNARTVLSPSGTRIGSLGMLFAALQYDLPVMYIDSVGYSSSETELPTEHTNVPDYRWHIWLWPTKE